MDNCSSRKFFVNPQKLNNVDSHIGWFAPAKLLLFREGQGNTKSRATSAVAATAHGQEICGITLNRRKVNPDWFVQVNSNGSSEKEILQDKHINSRLCDTSIFIH